MEKKISIYKNSALTSFKVIKHLSLIIDLDLVQLIRDSQEGIQGQQETTLYKVFTINLTKKPFQVLQLIFKEYIQLIWEALEMKIVLLGNLKKIEKLIRTSKRRTL